MSKLKKLNRLNKSKTLSAAMAVGLVVTNLVTVVPTYANETAGASHVLSTINKVTATTVVFDKKAPKDIAATITTASDLVGIKYGSHNLVAGTDYTVDGTTVTINASYLSTLAVGSRSLRFDFNTGSDPILTVKVQDTSSKLSITKATFSNGLGHGSDIKAKMTLNGNTLVGITNAGNELNEGSDYTVSGLYVTVSKTYLATLATGHYTLSFNFNQGTASQVAVNVINPNPTPVPVTLKSVSAVDGTVSVLLSGAPKTTPSIGDFVVKQTINNGTPTVITPSAITMTGAVANLTVAPVVATTAGQSVVYSVSYNGGTAKSAAAYNVDPASTTATVTAVSPVNITTGTGVAPVLPATVKATMSDGTTKDEVVTWDTVNASLYANAGTFAVNGTIADSTTVKAVANVTVTASQYSVSINSAELLAASQAGDLIANGQTTMKVVATINVPVGQSANDFVGQAEFTSTIGLKAAQQITAFDNGTATFYVPITNSVLDETDEIYIKVTTNQGQLVQIFSPSIQLTYKGYTPNGTKTTQNVYTIDSVKSTDMADRVDVYVGNVANQDVASVKQSIIKQLKLYNDNTLANPINIVDIVSDVPVSSTATTTSYAFRAVLQEKPFNAAGYTREDLASDSLTDNQYNYYSVSAADASSTVYLKQVDPSTSNKFMLIDGTIPRINDVKAPLTSDPTYLQPNTLLAQFSEPVNRLTSEDPTNWILNGHKLTANDVRYIRVMDQQDQDTDAVGLQLHDVTKNKVIANTSDDLQRNNVVISLTNSAAALYLQQGQNLLQARSISDIAGLTDLSDNNVITTQDFTFNYDKPSTDPQLSIKEESPEQWVLNLNQPLYTDQASKNELDLSAAGAVKVELLSDPLKALIVDVTADSRIVKLSDGSYILELTKDWTKELTEPTAYHNNWFRVTILGTVYDVYGVKVDNTLLAEKQIPEDDTSPQIDKTKVSYLGAGLTYSTTETSAYSSKGMPIYTTDAGDMQITMTEPVQLFSNAAVLMQPGLTPSTVQDQIGGVPIPTFEYVKIQNTTDNPLMSVGTKIDGSMYAGGDEHDNYFSVKPNSPLEAGEWKLVVRQISDDVGNTMSTEEIPFYVNTPVVAQNKVDPYVVWSYADDDRIESDGKTTDDYVYILYSRQMSIDAIRAATYNINGKQLTQDADITATPVILFGDNSTPTKYYGQTLADGTKYKPQWEGELVTIKLPNTFIVGGDDILNDGDDGLFRKNVLTIPTTLTAVDDNDSTTTENLLFDNNGGSNQYELTFDKNYGTTGIALSGVVPPITYAPDANYISAQSYLASLNQVAGNQAPVLATVPDQTLYVGGQAKDITLSATDADNDTLSYNVIPLGDAANYVQAVVVGNRLTINPLAAGTAKFTVTVTDGKVTTNQQITVTVNAAATGITDATGTVTSAQFGSNIVVNLPDATKTQYNVAKYQVFDAAGNAISAVVDLGTKATVFPAQAVGATVLVQFTDATGTVVGGDKASVTLADGNAITGATATVAAATFGCYITANLPNAAALNVTQFEVLDNTTGDVISSKTAVGSKAMVYPAQTAGSAVKIQFMDASGNNVGSPVSVTLGA